MHASDANEFSDDEPELAGYEPTGDRPLRGERIRRMLRVIVVIAIVALVLPGILGSIALANRTAQATCAAYTAYFAPMAVGSVTRFELFGAAIGWNCYAESFGGDEVLVANLGLIPGGARLPTAPLERT
ncbi:MAG: hypothetical protein M3Y46_09010 [Actinomycetota bacterium]|nr:hypothetical protein [Actinomycetota bacterium]